MQDTKLDKLQNKLKLRNYLGGFADTYPKPFGQDSLAAINDSCGATFNDIAELMENSPQTIFGDQNGY